MIMGYTLGQKYFPIPYKIKAFFGYSLLALLLYGLGDYLQAISTQKLNYYLIGNGILILFIAIAYFSEKSNRKTHAEN
jgi:hypothetical protein